MDQASRRENTAQRINAIMARFPLILDILEELDTAAFPSPADDAIRHGTHRGLTEILGALAKVDRAPPVGTSEPSDAEDLAGTWLLGFKVREHVPADFFLRLQPLIHRVLPPKTPVSSGQK
ncbi:MAG: hypothetical protein ABI600_18110 [Luteolibacter sp.]